MDALKRNAIAWSQWVIENRDRYVILDTETTGLGYKAQPIEVAIIDLYGNIRFNSRIKPSVPIYPEATAVHHINIEMLQDVCKYPTYHPYIEEAVKNKIVLIYNAQFDVRIINQVCSYYELPSSLNKARGIDCVMKRYSDFIGEWDARRQRNRWQKLPGGDHSALGDCVVTFNKVLKPMAECLII